MQFWLSATLLGRIYATESLCTLYPKLVYRNLQPVPRPRRDKAATLYNVARPVQKW